MTPLEISELIRELVKAFGLPGLGVALVIYLFVTRQNRVPEKSPLEQDIRDIKAVLSNMQGDIGDIQTEQTEARKERRDTGERLVRMETRMEGKAR